MWSYVHGGMQFSYFLWDALVNKTAGGRTHPRKVSIDGPGLYSNEIPLCTIPEAK